MYNALSMDISFQQIQQVLVSSFATMSCCTQFNIHVDLAIVEQKVERLQSVLHQTAQPASNTHVYFAEDRLVLFLLLRHRSRALKWDYSPCISMSTLTLLQHLAASGELTHGTYAVLKLWN